LFRLEVGLDEWKVKSGVFFSPHLVTVPFWTRCQIDVRPGRLAPWPLAVQKRLPLHTFKRAVLIALCATLGVSLQGCAGHFAPSAARVDRLVEQFIAAVNAADTAAFVAFFADDATAFFPTNAARISGTRAIRDAVAPAFAQGPRSNPARANDLQVTVDGDFAVASFDAGNGSMHARRTLILKLVKGEWKIVHLHASNVAELP
jgi:ketosteroid isomerase-like protein